MSFSLLLLLMVMICSLSVTSAVNVTSLVGETVSLPCEASPNSDVDWRHKDTPTSPVYYVYTNGVVYDIFQPRFTVDRRPHHGEYDLVISRVQLTDSGLYICIGDKGLGPQRAIYQLSVTAVVDTSTESGSTIEVDDEDEDDSNTSVVVVVVVVVLLVILAVISVFVVVVVVIRQRRRHQKRVNEQRELLPDVQQNPSITSGTLVQVTAHIRDLEDKISTKRHHEYQLSEQLRERSQARRDLQEQIERLQQSGDDQRNELDRQTQAREELIGRLERTRVKERDLEGQTQRKSDKIRQVKSELEALKEATYGLEVHLKKQVKRQEEIEEEMKELGEEVDEEASKRKSKDVLAKLKELAERENTLQVELKEVRYLKVEIPRQLKENSRREQELGDKLARVEEKASNVAELLKAKSAKRGQLEAEVAAANQAETRLKEKLELETETGNRLKTRLDELEGEIGQTERELRDVTDELATLMSELDKAKLEESRRRRDAMETERYEGVVRDETLVSDVDQLPVAHSGVHQSTQPTV